MRPIRLYLENFGSFRKPAEVDFADVDYFALVGPTGAGKSTVIDAICFALYGTVPRWGKENVVAYALAPSAASGRVALVFEVSGRRYGIVRSLLRDARNSVRTKEARLDELDPGAPADSPVTDLLAAVRAPVAEGDQVTAEVQRLTGLEYKFFTQCVVLPQGRFAEFLHAQPRERQDLLVQLLDADVYERIRQRAVREEESARQRIGFARGELDRLTGADEAAETAAAARVEALGALAARVGADLASLTGHDTTVRGLQEERRAAAVHLTTLTRLTLPAEVPGLADALRTADDTVRAAAEAVAALAEREQRADQELADLGDQGVLLERLSLLDGYLRAEADTTAARAEAGRAVAALPPLAARAEQAERALAAAERERDHLRVAHAGAELARTLTAGDPCPTCLRPIAELPHHPALAGLDTAETAVATARKTAATARSAHEKATAEASVLTRNANTLAARLTTLADAVTPAKAGSASDVRADADGTVPDARAEAATTATNSPTPAATVAAAVRAEREAIGGLLAAIEKAADAAGRARRELRQGRSALAAAEGEVARLRKRAERSWRELESARDAVAVFRPPPIDREELHRAWTALLAWRDQAAAAERAADEQRAARVAEAVRVRDGERAALVARLAELGLMVEVTATPVEIGQVVAAGAAQAEHRLARVREARARARELAEQVAGYEEQARVAHELGLLLRANQFERWLCAEALELLVAAASDTLRDLSDGQYELVLGGKGEIEVVDYAEAGMRRNARTLSGGETFQAALALALALSDQVAGLAAAAARSLDSIFLDEGFGTLDPATLDTVASTLERLAAGRERMIGVVTHVPALADRIPVRYEITRDPSGSHVQRTTQ
ncbi:AAA family ATPase [Acrocarpospora catenulata]|uniref:AAA family ATPase n=1 Tax=Acrocarpospora catenulata TaxID=2836182 RepID=UPI001BD9F435|nr:SMC family ATPase [Acrocarpospora catenulata]